MLYKSLENKKIAVLGLGREGQALLDFFKRRFPGKPITVFQNDREADLNGFDVVFKSPGISLYHPKIQQAIQNGVHITSASSLFLANTKATTIGITGTKGKSTTSSLLAHVLTQMGKRVLFGGNIGQPLINLDGQDADYLVAEISSYQAADLEQGFDITIVTNLYPEHIDWHGTHDRYYHDKMNVVRVRKPGQKAFINGQNAKSVEMAQGLPNIIDFNDPLMVVPIGHLKGAHNLENVRAVLAVVHELGLSTVEAIRHIQTFESLPHRLQTVAKINGVTFVDDSISTTPETVLAGLKAFEGKRIILLVGGYDRAQDYACLTDYIKLHPNISVIAMPDTGRRVAGHQVADMIEAVRLAKQLANPGDVVLLSPGAPSYNLYVNFEARGKAFETAALDN